MSALPHGVFMGCFFTVNISEADGHRAVYLLLWTCERCFSLLTRLVDLRHRSACVGVQRCQVVSHHAGAVLRPHLQALRLPEGQSVTPRTATESESWNTVVFSQRLPVLLLLSMQHRRIHCHAG